MNDGPQTVSVTILDKEYQISCPSDEVDALMESAAFLDHRMKEIKKNSQVYGLERVAIMAALNIANDYISQSNQTSEITGSQEDSLKILTQKVDFAIKRIKAIN